MDHDIERKTQERLKAELAEVLFARLDAAVESERTIERKVAELTAELAGVRAHKKAVEKLIRDAGIRRTGSAGQEVAPSPEPAALTVLDEAGDVEVKTQKSLIVDIIRQAGEQGIRAAEIGNEFQRLHGKDIGSSVHKQVQRLSKEGKIRRQGEGWKLAQKNAG